MRSSHAKPLLVIGPGRGGTSLLAALMDSHRQLDVVFEKYAEKALMREVLGESLEARIQSGAVAFYQACESYRLACTGAWWGNKITTEQLSGLQPPAQRFATDGGMLFRHFFDDIFRDYAFVFIQRDGRTCVRSKMARTDQDLEAACSRWEFSVAVQGFLRKHPRAHSIHYEDLVTAPTETLEGVCRFLDVPFDPDMLRGTNHAGLNADYRHGEFAQARVALEDLPEGCEQRLAASLVAAGYQPNAVP